jgi:NAD(P)-dependent dehydrogenase (short-subunit alcohol dehydrogenase family)
MPNSANTPRRTLLLTGASRGIGHATVIRFSSAGWRVITCSRHPFPEDCPWDAGPEDHIQVDLADHADTTRAIAEIRERLEGGALHALVNNAAISPKGEGGSRLGTMDTDVDTWLQVFPRQLLRADHAGARADRGIEARQGFGRERHLDRGLARATRSAGVAYATSKAALASLTREMASDFGRVGVRVNSIAPGEIDTSILSPGTEKIVDQQIPDASSRHAGRGRQDHLRAVHRNQFVRERRRDPHQRRPARLTAPVRGARSSTRSTNKGSPDSRWDASPPRLRCMRNCGRPIRPLSFAASRGSSGWGESTR